MNIQTIDKSFDLLKIVFYCANVIHVKTFLSSLGDKFGVKCVKSGVFKCEISCV